MWARKTETGTGNPARERRKKREEDEMRVVVEDAEDVVVAVVVDGECYHWVEMMMMV